jgi:hypothetical protein
MTKKKRKAKTVISPKTPFFLSSWRFSFFCLSLILPLLFLHPEMCGLPGGGATPQLSPDQPYALIFGTVWGPDDHPVYGVRVKIRRARDKKPKWQLYSNHIGEFAQRVPAGQADYVVWVDQRDLTPLDGKPLHLVQEVQVHVEKDERVDVGVHLTR